MNQINQETVAGGLLKRIVLLLGALLIIVPVSIVVLASFKTTAELFQKTARAALGTESGQLYQHVQGASDRAIFYEQCGRNVGHDLPYPVVFQFIVLCDIPIYRLGRVSPVRIVRGRDDGSSPGEYDSDLLPCFQTRVNEFHHGIDRRFHVGIHACCRIYFIRLHEDTAEGNDRIGIDRRSERVEDVHPDCAAYHAAVLIRLRHFF